MVKPSSLWALMKSCEPITLGRVCASLGGQSVSDLSAAETALVSVVAQDSEWMDERIEGQRDRWKDRQTAKRLRDKQMSRNVTVTSGDTDDVTQCHGDIGDTPPCHDTSVHPSIPPSVHPSTQIYTDTDADRGCRGISASASESALINRQMQSIQSAGKRPNVWTMDEDEFQSTNTSTTSLLSYALGKGQWKRAVAQAGDEAVRELFLVFRAEISAGESVSNPAAAFTARLKTDLGVTF